jgi:uncharacterized protein (DUF362 family)
MAIMKRRTFIAALGLAGTDSVLGWAWPRTVSAMSTSRRARVVTVRRPEVFGNSYGSDVRKLGIDSKLVRKMVHESVTALVGTKTSDDAWKKLFGPRDVVGVKINCLGGRMLSSHPAVVDGIIEGLRAAGVPDKNIIVWDRFSRELKAAGFAINVAGDGVRYLGTDELGYGYTSEPIVYRSIGSCFSMILASRCNAIISVPLMKDHDIAGVTLNLKNFFGAIQKPSMYHDNRCDPYIADLNAHPLIKDKNRLIICDALTGVYDGGPGYNPDAAWKYGGVMASTDAVALDRVGATIVEKKRSEAGKPPLKDVGREPVHIHTAAELGLGCDDPDKIEVVEV